MQRGWELPTSAKRQPIPDKKKQTFSLCRPPSPTATMPPQKTWLGKHVKRGAWYVDLTDSKLKNKFTVNCYFGRISLRPKHIQSHTDNAAIQKCWVQFGICDAIIVEARDKATGAIKDDTPTVFHCQHATVKCKKTDFEWPQKVLFCMQ